MNMKQLSKRDKSFAISAMIFGVTGILCCVASLGLSVTDSVYSKYTLTVALMLLGLNRICLHLSKHKDNFIYNFFVTGLMFVLGILVALSGISIYFLTVSFFIYSILIASNRVFIMMKEKTVQSIILNSLIIGFCFLYSFIFLFPSIYEKHATSVTNWNFIVLSYTMIVLFTCFKNALIPVHKMLMLDRVGTVVKRTMTLEILMGLLFLVTLFSIYFTLVEPSMVSFMDSLWYCFSVVTTIGFGDVTVSTTLGRILSVILGIYGLIVVGLVTSIIISFYNEFYRKREEKLLERIEKKEEDLEELEMKKNEEQK